MVLFLPLLLPAADLGVSLKITCAGCAQLAGKLLNIYQRPC
jgi:hypothetical protein